MKPYGFMSFSQGVPQPINSAKEVDHLQQCCFCVVVIVAVVCVYVCVNHSMLLT